MALPNSLCTAMAVTATFVALICVAGAEEHTGDDSTLVYVDDGANYHIQSPPGTAVLINNVNMTHLDARVVEQVRCCTFVTPLPP